MLVRWRASSRFVCVGVMATKLEVAVCVDVMASKSEVGVFCVMASKFEVCVCWCDGEQVRGWCVGCHSEPI